MGLQPPTLCCTPMHRMMPVMAGTAGQSDQQGSAPRTVPIAGHWSPPNPKTLTGEVTISAGAVIVALWSWCLDGVPSPASPCSWASQKGTLRQPSAFPVYMASSVLVPGSSRGGKQVPAAVRKTPQPGVKFPSSRFPLSGAKWDPG